jgi:hypothetical protein
LICFDCVDFADDVGEGDLKDDSFNKKQPLFQDEREAEQINAISVINQKYQRLKAVS